MALPPIDQKEAAMHMLRAMPGSALVDILKQVADDRTEVKSALLDSLLANEYSNQVQAFLNGDCDLHDSDEETDYDSEKCALTDQSSSAEHQPDTPTRVDVDNCVWAPLGSAAMPTGMEVGSCVWARSEPQRVTLSLASDLPAVDTRSSTEKQQLNLCSLLVRPPPGLGSAPRRVAEEPPVSGVAPGLEKQQLNLSSLLASQVCEQPVVEEGPADEESCEQDDCEAARQRTLLIAYFPRRATEEDLFQVLGAVANVEQVRLVRETTGDSRCFGFVEFESRADAEAVMNRCEQRRIVLDDEVGHTWHLTASWSRRALTLFGQGRKMKGRKRGKRGGGARREQARREREQIVAARPEPIPVGLQC